MIEINLLPGVKRKRAGGGKIAILGGLRGLGTRIKDPMLLAGVAVCALVFAWLAWGYVSNAARMHTLEPRLEQARQENLRFKTLLQEKRRTEAIRDSLLAQITVIRTVDGNRYIWPHILDEVARALPPYTWLTQVDVLNTPTPADTSADSTAVAPVNFEIQGRTVTIESYTRFLRQLEASPWLSDVQAMQAQTVVEEDRPVTAFTIQAKFQRADSAYIRTVPFSKSVR